MLSTLNAAELSDIRHKQLRAEAEQARLAALLPHNTTTGLRHEVAVACYRLATWLDAQAEYVQLPEPGAEDWVSGLAGR